MWAVFLAIFIVFALCAAFWRIIWAILRPIFVYVHQSIINALRSTGMSEGAARTIISVVIVIIIILIILVVTIVVLLILAGVSMSVLFGDSGLIEKAKDAQNKWNDAKESDVSTIDNLNRLIDNQVDGKIDIATVFEKTVDKNTIVEDAYGNKIIIPKGFKVLPHGTERDSATYTYSGDTIPAVQDGIVIENETDGNQLV